MSSSLFLIFSFQFILLPNIFTVFYQIFLFLRKVSYMLKRRTASAGFFPQIWDNRTFIDAVFWVLITGSPWRDLPPDYGHWSNVHRRFIRWRDKGVWEKLMEILILTPQLNTRLKQRILHL